MNPVIAGASILSALSNPATANAAFTLLELATASFRLMQDLDKPEMTPEAKKAAWDEIGRLKEKGNAALIAAIENHPAWKDQHPDAQLPES